jgi:hypothetical protein
MQRSIWSRPALQQSEAVMMPALQRRIAGEPQLSDVYYRTSTAGNPFQEIVEEQKTPPPSTYVKPRGSMGGRGVLRAVGMTLNLLQEDGKPAYHPSVASQRSSTEPDSSRHEGETR